jgi:uncharacterized membrane protein SpoIIM required for sporulation
MNEEAILEKRIAGWQILRELLEKSAGRVERLSPEDQAKLLRYYRAATADLANLRTSSSNPEVVRYLNQLVGEAYAVIYRAPSRRFREVLDDALFTVADTVRRRASFMLASACVFFLAAVAAFAMMGLRPDLREFLMPPEMQPVVESWTSGELPSRTGAEGVMMTGFYASNNPRVAMFTVGTALPTLGLGTMYILWTNGLLLGSLSYEMAQVGLLHFLWISVMPHGATELTGIVVAGAAGLVIGWSVINPGRYRVSDSIRQNGKDAFVLMGLAVVMMFLAAPVEGFFSFEPGIPLALKAVVALVILTGWIAYFVLYGRDRSAAEANERGPRRSS